MKRLILAAVLAGVAGLAGCEDRQYSDEYTERGQIADEAPVAPAAEDFADPAADTAVVETPPAAPQAAPQPPRTSAETVRPESETLFY